MCVAAHQGMGMLEPTVPTKEPMGAAWQLSAAHTRQPGRARQEGSRFDAQILNNAGEQGRLSSLHSLLCTLHTEPRRPISPTGTLTALAVRKIADRAGAAACRARLVSIGALAAWLAGVGGGLGGEVAGVARLRRCGKERVLQCGTGYRPGTFCPSMPGEPEVFCILLRCRQLARHWAGRLVLQGAGWLAHRALR